MTDDSESLPPIVQVIGVAYTFKPSLAVRHHLTKSATGDHSSKDIAAMNIDESKQELRAQMQEQLQALDA